MSDKIKHPASRARVVAEKIVAALKPVCTRIEIAGSLRTGSKETNMRLAAGALSCNRRFHAYGHDHDGITDAIGNPVTVTSEREVFELCCLPYLEPHQR